METLGHVFGTYLLNTIPEVAALRLMSKLHAAGLNLEAILLHAYLEGLASISCKNEWTTQPIALGTKPPIDPHTGDCWFDPLELVLCTFVPATEDRGARAGGWYATHPVQVWQYLGFVDAVSYHYVEKTAFPMFSKDRIDQRDPMAIVTNIFSFEAHAYSQWFGKTLIGEKISCAKAVMPIERLLEIAPPKLLLWDADSAYGHQDQPLAFNLNTCEYDDIFELLEREFPEEDRLIYGEWERTPRVGFATYVEATGLSYSLDGSLYPFLKSDNVPVR
jgi:hypothetical protein